MSKGKLIYGGLSILIIVGTIMASGMIIKAKPQPRKNNQKHNSMYVKVQKVVFTETESNMVYRGRVTAFDEIALGAEVQGKIMQGDVRFKDGENFKKGDVLVNIYCEDVKAAIKSGKSSFLQTLSVIIPDLKIDYPNEFQKWNTFFNALDVEKPLPQLPAINSTKEKVFLASNNVLSSYYNLQQKEINLKRYTITAPFNGSFKEVNREIGAVASPGVELATIIRSDKLEVTVPVFPSDLHWIEKGEKVLVIDNEGDTKTATVSRISSFVDETTQSVNVYLTYYAEGSSGFLQGEYVDIRFSGTKISGFEIPREALIDGSYVYELKDLNLVKQSVNILRQLNDSYIISGINENKLIVTESLATVNPTIEYLAR